MNSRFEVYSCFIDIRKAFDSVDHEILMNKLLDCGIPEIYINVIKYWYNNQFVNIRYMSCLSERWKIKNGVRQGGVLSGLFFGIYIDSVIDNVASMKYGCRLGIHDSSIIVYADDIVLMAPSWTGLQFLIDITCNEAKKLKLEVNKVKSKSMLFSNNYNKYDKLIHVRVDGKEIESVTPINTSVSW